MDRVRAVTESSGGGPRNPCSPQARRRAYEGTVSVAGNAGTSPRLWFIWITAQTHDLDHAVLEEDLVAAQGEYRAACGAAFLPAPME